MAKVRVLLAASTKKKIIRGAIGNGRSMISEVTVALLKNYRPPGWKDLERGTLARSVPQCGPRPGIIDDGAPESIFLVIPDVLKVALQDAAQKSFRSVAAEVRYFLDTRYGSTIP